MYNKLAKNAYIGILGGGQLAQMTCESAKKLGFKTHIYCDVKDSPAFAVCDKYTIGDYQDKPLVKSFAESVDVITYEFENIPDEIVSFLEKNYILRPNAKALHICQMRSKEKEFVNELLIKTAKYSLVKNKNDIENFLKSNNHQSILKTNKLGYDGKGQYVIDKDFDLNILNKINFNEQEFIIEEKLDFDCEISVLIARDSKNNISIFPITRNIHQNGILAKSLYPADIDDYIEINAQEIAKKIISSLDYVGILAVELFVLKDGSLRVNELAPRPHNSGHWTIDGCNYSQYDLFLKAITNNKLPKIFATHKTEMVNLIGEDIVKISQLRSMANVKVYDYGKNKVISGRKMGHYTLLKSTLK